MILSVFFAGIISLPVIVEAQTYYINVQKMPVQWQNEFGDVLYQATEYWKSRIPSLEFYEVPYPDQSDFVVTWASQYLEGKLGYYTTNTNNYYGKPYVAITLGYFEDKKWNLVSRDYVIAITKHEMGHAIGLEHSNDPNDIMYPTVENYEDWVRSHSPESYVGQTNDDEYFSSDASPSLSEMMDQILAEEKKYENPANEAKSYYENLIFDDLANGITRAEKSLSGLKFESQDAQKKIKQAWDVRWQAVTSKNKADKKFAEALNYLNDGRYLDSYSSFKTIDSDSESIGNNLKWISAAIEDANKMEKKYQTEKVVELRKQKEKFCFLFWCW